MPSEILNLNQIAWGFMIGISCFVLGALWRGGRSLLIIDQMIEDFIADEPNEFGKNAVRLLEVVKYRISGESKIK